MITFLKCLEFYGYIVRSDKEKQYAIILQSFDENFGLNQEMSMIELICFMNRNF